VISVETEDAMAMEQPATSAGATGERARMKALLDGQHRILRLIHEDRPLAETLTQICLMIEGQVEGMLASILLLDEEGTHLMHGAAPNLPAEYIEAIDRISIGPNVGACGAAAYTGEPCLIEDVATHPNCVAFREVAYVRCGLRGLWSTPIRAYDGRVVATFAMYYRVPKLPTLADRKLIDFTSHLVTIAVNRHRDREFLGADA
jgi:GAF domain-containing protein